MALLGQGFSPSYVPDYSGVNRANEQFGQAQRQIFSDAEKKVTDYAQEQKDLAQKDKEMAAKIKGTMSLLDNAKALYPEFAQQIDSTKTQLSDPGLSNLDKSGIASQVENSLNMMTAKGTEATKTALQIAEMQQRYDIAGMKPAKEPKYELQQFTDPSGNAGFFRVDLNAAKATPITISSDPTSNQSANQTSSSASTGNLPMQIPTVEGALIDPTKAKPAGYDTVGRQRVISDGKLYHLNIDTGTLPDNRPLDKLSEQATQSLIKRSENAPVGLGGSFTGILDTIQPQVSNAGQAPAVKTINNAAIASAVNQQTAAPRSVDNSNIKAASNLFTKVNNPREEAALNQAIAQTELAKAQLGQIAGKAEAAQTKEEQSQKSIIADAQNAQKIFDISLNRVKPIINNIGSGVGSDIYRYASAWAGSSDQFKLEQALKPITYGAMWEQMKAMRKLSSTGSTGLGALSNAEGDALKSTIASLDSYQTPENLKYSLRIMEDHMNNAKYGNSQERQELVNNGKMTPSQYNEIEKKYLNPSFMPTDGMPSFNAADQELLNRFK